MGLPATRHFSSALKLNAGNSVCLQWSQRISFCPFKFECDSAAFFLKKLCYSKS